MRTRGSICSKQSIALFVSLAAAAACSAPTAPVDSGDRRDATASDVRSDISQIDSDSALDAGPPDGAAEDSARGDAGSLEDTSADTIDGGVADDTGVAADAGLDADTGALIDARSQPDASEMDGAVVDADVSGDSGAAADTGITDARVVVDSGADTDVGSPVEVCSNSVDDDGDRLADCADPDCSADPRCAMCVPTGAENTAAACSDGRDNDCNRLTDCADPACSSFAVCCRPTGPESGRAACTDGRDNDCDGQLDCADNGCTPLRASGSTECCNGRDDDSNSVVDEFACACSTNADCVGVGAGGMIQSPACYLVLPVMAPPVCGIDCRTLGGDSFCSMFSVGFRCNFMTGACVR